MAQQLYFSRDTKMFLEFDNVIWEIPVLDGFSFSQATNSSEITLNEMESSAGVSRRGRRAFNDSLAAGEWSFSTYVRPFTATGAAQGTGSADTQAKVHAIEEVLWALMAGAKDYVPGAESKYQATPTGGSAQNVAAPGTSTFDINFGQSNVSALGTFNLYFVLGDANRTVMKLDGCVVGEASIDFDIDGIATIAWSGNCANVKDFTGSTVTATSDDLVTEVTVNGQVSSGATTINLDAGHGAVQGDLLFGTGLPATGAPITNVSTNAITVAATSAIISDDAVLLKRKPTGDGTAVAVGDVFLDSDDSHKLFVFTGTAGTFVPLSETKTNYVNEAITQTTNFIRNRLTVLDVALSASQRDPDSDGTNELEATYSLTLTGGNVTVSNNITFITPEEIGIVNVPIGHVTGTRSVSGSFTCYLTEDTTTTNASRDFFEDLRDITNVVTNSFDLTFKIGGASGTGLELEMPTCHVEIPTHSIEDVISLETTFQALPSTIDGTNELLLKYRP
jgi:hypothetical protein|tara:strand:- start:6459 stop:7976 length:1518 start_codon:yes stop_codon:yes gene_type:complete